MIKVNYDIFHRMDTIFKGLKALHNFLDGGFLANEPMISNYQIGAILSKLFMDACIILFNIIKYVSQVTMNMLQLHGVPEFTPCV